MTYDWTYVTLLSFSQSNILNLLCQKRRRYEMKLMKNKWRFARHMNALKQQSLLNRWHIFKFKRTRSKWNAKIDKRRRVQTDENKNRCVSFNFASSCYHHHCCCSNERFFKSETSLSISIKSLLTFFAVAFIFYCQAIIVKSMFNFHQVDLSSRNSFFIHISNVSFSLIMFATVWYMMFLLVSRFSETLHFDEHNIIKIFERFEKQCDEYEIIEKKWWIKLFRYCIKFIAEFMKIFSSYVDRSWKIFEKKMQKEYKDQNIEQMINFRLFLKKFKNKVKKNNQMRIYSWQFKNISIKLIKWGQLNIIFDTFDIYRDFWIFIELNWFASTILTFLIRTSWYLSLFIRLWLSWSKSMMFYKNWIFWTRRKIKITSTNW